MRRNTRIPRIAALAVLAALALLPTATAQAGGGLSTNPGADTVPGAKAKLVHGKAIAPADAPRRVQKVIAATNKIRNKPYKWGGGHGNWNDKGYDCSGSVSYALHGAALLGAPLVSGDLSRWGESGPGQWVTIYANAGHVYMTVAGLRFDTSGQRQAGTRWQPVRRSNRGFRVRHPAGL